MKGKNLKKSVGLLLAVLLGMTGIVQIAGAWEPRQTQIPETEFTDLLDKIADSLFYILLFIAVIMIVIAAYQFATAAGDDTKLKNARNAVLWAIVAVIVAFLARSIIDFIADRLR